MANPRAQRPLTLDKAVSDIQSLAQPAQAMGDMLASTLRGSVAATAGLPGDIRELIDLFGPEAVERVLGKRVMPTTQDMNKMLPPAVPTNAPASRQHTANVYGSLGEFLPLPGSGAATKAAGYGLGRAAGAGTRAAGQAISDAMIHQTGPLASGPLSALAPRMAMTNVVKPKGGNWLTGSVEKTVKPLKSENRQISPALLEGFEQSAKDATDPLQERSVRRLREHNDEIAINKWVDSNLAGYMKKEMGTPEDPVRALFEKRTQEIEANYTKDMEKSARLKQRAEAEQDPRKAANFTRESQRIAEEATAERELKMQHVAHFPKNEVEFANAWIPEELGVKRLKGGYPTLGMGESPTAKAWETMADQAINVATAAQHTRPLSPTEIRQGYQSTVDDNPWLTKLAPDTRVYYPESTPADLGFDHVVDVLRQDVASGRIRPEQLNKVSMEDAVRRAAEVDLEMARKLNASKAAAREGLPVHKEYPEGYKWIQLNKPGAFNAESQAMGHSVKGYEPPKGHPDWVEASGDVGSPGYGHGGWEAIKSGKAKVYSLVNKKGEPHVTVEVKHPEEVSDELRYKHRDKINEGMSDYFIDNPDATHEEALQSVLAGMKNDFPPSITQIKGKSNRAPNEEYLPYVQDFVRGGKWSDVGDFHNTGLIDMNKSAIPWSKNIQPEQIDQLVGGMEGGTKTPRYGVNEFRNKALNQIGKRYITQQEFDDFLLKELTPPEEGMNNGGTPRRYPTEQERDAMRKLRESFLPAAKDAERLKRLRDNMERSEQKRVSMSDNPDTMMMELNEAHMGKGGVAKEGVEGLLKLVRAPAKKKEEIEAIAQRIAPQMTGEYVRGKEGAKTVAGKTQKQFEREKTLQHDIRPTEGVEQRTPSKVDYETMKDNVVMGIAGDPTRTGVTVHGVAGTPLKSPSPQHGGPLYGLARDDDQFWASNLTAARNVQNRAKEIEQQYGQPVLGQYIMMGPDSYSYAQHFADTNMNLIDPAKMSKRDIESFNKMVREGYPYVDSKKVKRQRVFPSFPGIENPEEMYLQFAIDPDMRKHFGNLMQMPTVTEPRKMPSGLDVMHAVTEPELRDLEIGVTGHSVGRMLPDVNDLQLSSHPTYSHDIPGNFLGQSKYPIPYDLMFPDSLKAVRENPKQAPQELGSLKMIGPRQTIDQQMIDEIKQYEEFIKKYTGKKKGGEVHMADGGITGDDLILEERPL